MSLYLVFLATIAGAFVAVTLLLAFRIVPWDLGWKMDNPFPDERSNGE